MVGGADCRHLRKKQKLKDLEFALRDRSTGPLNATEEFRLCRSASTARRPLTDVGARGARNQAHNQASEPLPFPRPLSLKQNQNQNQNQGPYLAGFPGAYPGVFSGSYPGSYPGAYSMPFPEPYPGSFHASFQGSHPGIQLTAHSDSQPNSYGAMPHPHLYIPTGHLAASGPLPSGPFTTANMPGPGTYNPNYATFQAYPSSFFDTGPRPMTTCIYASSGLVDAAAAAHRCGPQTEEDKENDGSGAGSGVGSGISNLLKESGGKGPSWLGRNATEGKENVEEGRRSKEGVVAGGLTAQLKSGRSHQDVDRWQIDIGANDPFPMNGVGVVRESDGASKDYGGCPPRSGPYGPALTSYALPGGGYHPLNLYHNRPGNENLTNYNRSLYTQTYQGASDPPPYNNPLLMRTDSLLYQSLSRQTVNQHSEPQAQSQTHHQTQTQTLTPNQTQPQPRPQAQLRTNQATSKTDAFAAREAQGYNLEHSRDKVTMVERMVRQATEVKGEPLPNERGRLLHARTDRAGGDVSRSRTRACARADSDPGGECDSTGFVDQGPFHAKAAGDTATERGRSNAGVCANPRGECRSDQVQKVATAKTVTPNSVTSIRNVLADGRDAFHTWVDKRHTHQMPKEASSANSRSVPPV